MLILIAHLHLMLLDLIPLDVLPPTTRASDGPVYPQQSNGFAAYVVGGFFGIGVLIVAMILMGTKPRRRSNRRL